MTDVTAMKDRKKRFLVKMPQNTKSGADFTIKTYDGETSAAILESNGETFGFEVIAEITGNDFYSDEAVSARGGKLLTLEIERRWLVKIPKNIGDFPYERIEQAYLSPESGFQGRIRRLDDKYIYTEKARTDNFAARIENEREISAEEYAEMRKHTILNPVKKRRYLIPSGGLTFELDVFENTAEEGFAIMEAELETETSAVEIPDFVEVVREVTSDGYYTNRNFASMDVIKLLK